MNYANQISLYLQWQAIILNVIQGSMCLFSEHLHISNTTALNQRIG